MDAEALIGREDIVQRLTELVLGGAEVLLYGPLGIGKTSVLEAVAARARAAGRPCGLATRTMSLGDATRALAGAYPEVRAATQKRLRGCLRRCVEEHPAVWNSPVFVDIPRSVIRTGGVNHGTTQATEVHRAVQG